MIIRERHNTRLGVVSYNLHWHSECANNDDDVDDDHVDDVDGDNVDDDTMTRMKMMPFAHHRDKVLSVIICISMCQLHRQARSPL